MRLQGTKQHLCGSDFEMQSAQVGRKMCVCRVPRRRSSNPQTPKPPNRASPACMPTCFNISTNPDKEEVKGANLCQVSSAYSRRSQ